MGVGIDNRGSKALEVRESRTCGDVRGCGSLVLGDGDVTVKQQYTCPFCEYTAGEKQSVIFHITGRSDGAHEGKYGGDHWGDVETVDVDDTGSTSTESSESPDGSTDGSVQFPTADGGSSSVESSTESTEESSGSCCSNPDLRGEAGDVFELESGEYVRLESGDQICVNCDEIHE